MTRPYRSPLSRDGNPETSSEAAAAAVADGTVTTHEGCILAVLRKMPEGGTGREIAGAINARWKMRISHVAVMRRMADLIGEGLIERRPDPRDPWRLDRKGRRVPNLLKRDGQTLHFLTIRRKQLEFEFNE